MSVVRRPSPYRLRPLATLVDRESSINWPHWRRVVLSYVPLCVLCVLVILAIVL